MPTAGSIPLTFPDKLYASGIMHELPSPVMLNPIIENNKVFEKNIIINPIKHKKNKHKINL